MNIKQLFLSFFLSASLVTLAQNPALTLHYDRPAEFFEEAMVIGNGNLGGIVYGGTDCDVINLNDITLWTGEPDTKVYSPGAYRFVPEVRSALNKEDYRKANELQRELQGHYSENYQPLGTLRIDYADKSAVSNYERGLDISNALAFTRFSRSGKTFSAEYFVSAPDSVLVVSLESDAPISLTLSLASQLPNTQSADGNTITMDGYAAYHSLPNYVGSTNDFAYDPARGIHFRTMLRVVGGNVTVQGQTLKVDGSKKLTLLLSNVTSFNGFDKDPVREGRDYKTLVAKRIKKAASRVAKLKARHTADYKSLFDRLSLDFGQTDPAILAQPTNQQLYNYTVNGERNPQLEVLYVQYGRYLLISSSRTPGVPANLQGLWNESLLPPWSCNYTSNINVEENYWPAEVANLSELHMPMLQFVSNVSKTGNTSAREYYGVEKGWCLAHNTDIWAMSCPVGQHSGDPVWANWNMGGAWTSTHIWEHYTFTRDLRFLQQYYPVLRGAAEFCMGWMVEKDGKLMTSPSTSPENNFRMPDGYNGATLYGGSADVAMIRECLTDTKKAAELLGIDAELRHEIERTLERLLPYRISQKGHLQEWYHDWADSDPHHRHQSHLFGLYPGHQISTFCQTNRTGLLDKKPDYQDYTFAELQRACAKTLQNKGDNTTGWSAGWRVNLFARLGDADGAYHILRKLLSYVSPDNYRGPNRRTGGGTYPNLLDAHSPFQIDGNFGGLAGALEMLVQSTETTIDLLPALPSQWLSGSVRGIRTRGGFVVDLSWKDGRVTTFTISSQLGGTTTVYYNNTQVDVTLAKGRKQTITAI